MNLKEIVNRPDFVALSQDESIFLVREYLKARKGLDITPILQTTYDLDALVKAVPFAVQWFRMNPDKIKE